MSENHEQLQMKRERAAAYMRKYRRDNPEYVLRCRIRDAERLLRTQGYTVTKPGVNE